MAVMIPLYLTILLFFRNITQANKTRGPPRVDPLVVSDRRGLCLPRRVPRLRGIGALPRCARTCTVELEGQRTDIYTTYTLHTGRLHTASTRRSVSTRGPARAQPNSGARGLWATRAARRRLETSPRHAHG